MAPAPGRRPAAIDVSHHLDGMGIPIETTLTATSSEAKAKGLDDGIAVAHERMSAERSAARPCRR